VERDVSAKCHQTTAKTLKVGSQTQGLLAAAPEMFEALENALVALRREYDDASDCIKDAVAALAKAKGGAA